MNDRIRKLREFLKLSRAAFGDRIGVSGDVVNSLERGRVEIKDSTVLLIVRTFGVSESWLRDGSGPMFESGSELERILADHGLDRDSVALIESFASLSEDERRAVVHFVLDASEKIKNASGVSAAEDEYKRSLSSAPSAASSVSNTTGGIAAS